MIGSYALAYIQDNKLRIFVDECHTYALYYYIGREGVVVTNTYYHVEKVSKQEFDETVFATMLASVGLCSNRTPFKNIYRLLENEYIEYDFAIHQAIIKKVWRSYYILFLWLNGGGLEGVKGWNRIADYSP